MNWITWNGWSAIQGITGILGLVTVIAFLLDGWMRRRRIIEPIIEVRVCGGWNTTDEYGRIIKKGDVLLVENVGGTPATIFVFGTTECTVVENQSEIFHDVLSPGDRFILNVSSVTDEAKVFVEWMSHDDDRVLTCEVMPITGRIQKTLIRAGIRRSPLLAWKRLQGKWWYKPGDEKKLGLELGKIRIRTDRKGFEESFPLIGKKLEELGYKTLDLMLLAGKNGSNANTLDTASQDQSD